MPVLKNPNNKLRELIEETSKNEGKVKKEFKLNHDFVYLIRI